MNLSKLAELKQRLIDATDFSAVWTYFLDHFGERREFAKIGERTHDALIESLLIKMAKEVKNVDLDPEEILLTRLAEQQFIHGGCLKNGKMINVLYFEDIFMGTIMICAVDDPNTIAIRFSGRKLTEPPKPSMN
jgi:hypothetical protein